LLKDEADFFGAVADELAVIEFRKIDAIDDDVTGGEGVESAEDIDERGFAGAGRAHERDPFARVDREADAAESAESAVLLDQSVDDDLLVLNGVLRLLQGDDRTHASPRKTDAGRMLARRRNG